MLAAARLLRCSACEDAKQLGVKPVSESNEHREPSGTIPCLKREKCTCGYASMEPRDSQLDTSWPKVAHAELGSIILRQRQRNARSELSGTSARDGSSLRRVAESTQRRTTEESISSKKQTIGTFLTWRRSGLLETRHRQRCATTHTRQVSWRSCGAGGRARTSMKKTYPEDPRKVVWITHAGTLTKCAFVHSR